VEADPVKIGRNIRRYRAFNDIKQEHLATAAGISRRTLSNYENGITCVSVNHLIVIAERLNVEITVLLDMSK
jgi:transcriptional regulator with XRE-family HTH domain